MEHEIGRMLREAIADEATVNRIWSAICADSKAQVTMLEGAIDGWRKTVADLEAQILQWREAGKLVGGCPFCGAIKTPGRKRCDCAAESGRG